MPQDADYKYDRPPDLIEVPLSSVIMVPESITLWLEPREVSRLSRRASARDHGLDVRIR
jgi:hypothetical protein